MQGIPKRIVQREFFKRHLVVVALQVFENHLNQMSVTLWGGGWAILCFCVCSIVYWAFPFTMKEKTFQLDEFSKICPLDGAANYIKNENKNVQICLKNFQEWFANIFNEKNIFVKSANG